MSPTSHRWPRIPSHRRRKRKAKLLDAQNGKCFWCEIGITFEEATLDELLPFSRGGRQTLGNVVASCSPCNNRRGSMAASKNDLKRAAALLEDRRS